MLSIIITAAAAAKSLQSYPTLCDPIDGSPPGSRVPGILQARTLEWVAISFSNAWKWKVKVKSLSRVRLLATPWTAAYQGPLPMGFSRQEYWSRVPLPLLDKCKSEPQITSQQSEWSIIKKLQIISAGEDVGGKVKLCSHYGKSVEFPLLLFSHSAMSDSTTPWIAACRASQSLTVSWSLLKLMSIESVIPTNHLILSHSLLLLPSIFPHIRVFSNESALCISIGVSA